MVTLSEDGHMAITRDTLGGLRFWPSLTGAVEPQRIPIRGARQVSLSADGDTAILSIVDSISSLHIVRANADGSMEELYMSSPHAPIKEARVWPGGQRIVTLSADHRVALRSTAGAVLAELQERHFSPKTMRLVASKKQIYVFESEGAEAIRSVTLRTLQVDLDKNALVLGTAEQEIPEVFSLAAKRFAISTDGAHVAFLGPEKKSEEKKEKPPVPDHSQGAQAVPEMGLSVVAVATGETQWLKLPLPANELMSTSLAFGSDQEVVVSSRPTGGSWKVNLGTTLSSTPLASPVANDTQHSASDVAGGVRLAADGTWLYVQDVAKKSHRYLGYGAFDPQFSSISPNGERVAWSTGAMVFVESVHDDSKSIRITAPPTEAYFRAAFIDDTNLVAVDYSGGLHLIDWAEGREVSSLDTGGPVRELEVDQERKLVRGIRQNGGSWLVELGKEGLVGPYLVQDLGYRSGFLQGENALWTIDPKNTLREYSLGDIRSGLSAKNLAAKGEPLANRLPLAIDEEGRRYVVRSQGQGAILSVSGASDSDKSEIELSATPAQLHPSPDGTMLALVSANSSTVEVILREGGRSLWSRSFQQGIRQLSWSVDSKSVAVASQVGAIVQSADTGKALRVGCGPWFESRETPPPSTVSFMQVQNLCERMGDR